VPPTGNLAALVHLLSGVRQGGAALPLLCLLLPIRNAWRRPHSYGGADSAILGALLDRHSQSARAAAGEAERAEDVHATGSKRTYGHYGGDQL